MCFWVLWYANFKETVERNFIILAKGNKLKRRNQYESATKANTFFP